MENAEIKLRRDGSIDTQHYMQIGRKKRSEQAHRVFAIKWPRWPFSTNPKLGQTPKRVWGH